jgi:hypothetical protein
MDIKTLVRDSAKVFSALQELDDNSVIAKQECSIYIPARFAERSLAELGVENYITGICAIVVDGFYAVMNVCAMIKIEPSRTFKIKIKGDDYYEFQFDKGNKVIVTTELVKLDTLVYRIYDEIISKGRVPWYLDYNDLGKIFDTAKLHAGANIGQNSEVTELIVSLIARDRKDKTIYYRTAINSIDDVKRNPPAYIPLKSVIFAATNTTNKLAGSYFATSTVSALVSPASRTERIEHILRR